MWITKVKIKCFQNAENIFDKNTFGRAAAKVIGATEI